MASGLWIVGLLLLGHLNVYIVHAQYAGFGPPMYPGYGAPQPYPIIIKDDNNDDWHHILPLLILLLCDGWGGGWGGCGGGFGGGCGGCGGGCGGCGGGCGGGGCGGGGGCCNTIPIPYPIAIPINNPIIS